VDGALQAHLDAGAALRVQEMEGDAMRARGGEELDGNHGQAEGDIEVLQPARHGVCGGDLAFCGIRNSLYRRPKVTGRRAPHLLIWATAPA
jgi:hypothetical protein